MVKWPGFAMPSAHWKRAATKPRRIIDSCVLIAAPWNPDCSRYLAALGHQHHGLMTHNLLGEALAEVSRKFGDEALRRDFHLLVDRFLTEGKITILRLGCIPPEDVESLRSALPFLSKDDAVHLAEAMVHGGTEFVTIDKELTNRINSQRLP